MFQKSQVVTENERFLFEDQQVELLPARTTMTTAAPPTPKKKKNNNKAVAVATAVNVAVIKGDNNLVFQNANASATATAG